MDTHEPIPSRLKLGIGISLTAFLFFSIASALVWNFRGRFPTIQIIFIQNIVSLICILPIALRHGIKRLKTNEMPTHLLRDLFGVGSYFLYFLAIRYLNLVDATALNYTAPFFVPLIWRIWRNEKIRAHVWWSIVVGWIGIAVILNPSREIFQLGFVYGLFAGIASAVAFVALRILNLKQEPMSRTLFYYFSLGTLISFPFAAAVWVPPTPIEWWFAIAIGVATAVGQMLLTVAYRHGTASYLSPLAYSTVIYNALITYCFFDQQLGWHTLVGVILIIVGGTMTFIVLFRKKAAPLIETLKEPGPTIKPPPL
jgi:drug/metabolite transporter (DMT)-like permease